MVMLHYAYCDIYRFRGDKLVELTSFVLRTEARYGESLVGRHLIRRVLNGMIDSKTLLQSQVVKAITVGDVTLLYTDFQGTIVYPSRKTVESTYKAIEVLRRQPDGTWTLIVGDPNGRA